MMMRTYLAMTAVALLGACTTTPEPRRGLASLEKIAQVDERFLSYNVEMVEVTGGRFWAPYGGPEGEVYRMRPPENLADERLRALTRHLAPAYMRVSGTWANSTYLEAAGENLSEPPAGYRQVLTREQWRGLVDFAGAVGARIGVSHAVSEGPRGPDGVWQTGQAQRLLDLTREAGGELAFSEFINEPNAASLGHLPEGYSVTDYARDFRIFREWASRKAPGMLIVGPGGVGESQIGKVPVANLDRMLISERLLAANPASLDAFSFHFYGAVSQRCKNVSGPRKADRSEALAPEWLDLAMRERDYYAALRDRYEPGDPLWVTETAQAACGGSPWAASFVDTFRFVNQLGLLAQNDVDVVMHNTLAASDYSLIEEGTRAPRPNYWAAVLWKRLMGTTVLESPASPSPELRLYAHCLKGRPGGVAIAAINLSQAAQDYAPGGSARAWIMQANPLDSNTVTVNGHRPHLAENGSVAGLDAVRASRSLTIPGRSIAFIALDAVDHPACR